jgi:sulfate/thiosulfate transport system ATP-binding protein
MALEIENLVKNFGTFRALDGVTLKAEPGEFLALLGPSGSGKTTLLRILAGLENPDSGTVGFDGENLAAKSVRDRGAGFVFQHYALFRHMTVADNIGFGLKVRSKATRPPPAEIKRRVEALLALVQLESLGQRYPNQLSGGQRQRVALARALAIEPQILLLDEPFGALDAKVRKDLRRWLRRLHREMGLTSVFVTHDQEEALDLADRVVVMNKGRIEQVGAPGAVYANPANAFVYDFLGGANKLACTLSDGRVAFDGLTVERGDLRGLSGPAMAYARSEDLRLVGADAPGLDAVITGLFLAGPAPRVECRLNDGSFIELVPKPERAGSLVLGDQVRIEPAEFRVFPDA